MGILGEEGRKEGWEVGIEGRQEGKREGMKAGTEGRLEGRNRRKAGR